MRRTGLVPPGLTKSIAGGSGWTSLGGIPLLPFRLVGTRLAYRGLPLVDRLEPLPDWSWEGSGYVVGLRYCRFRLERARARAAFAGGPGGHTWVHNDRRSGGMEAQRTTPGGTDTALERRPGDASPESDKPRQQLEQKAHELREAAASRLEEQVDTRSTQVGREVQSFGEALRSGAGQLRSEGKVSSAGLAEQAAQRADRLGGYLQSADAQRLLADAERFARQRPWLTAAAGAAAGFLASRFLKASSDRRYEAARGDGRTAYAGMRGSVEGAR